MAGWLSVTAGIVSIRLNISENFLDHLVCPSFKHLGPLTPIPNSTGNPFIGGVKYMKKKKKISHRLGPLRGSSSPFWPFEPARVEPN